MKMLKQMEGKT